MNRQCLIGQRLIALAIVGVLLFNYPILALFDQDRTVLGIPMLYLYLFLVWAALIWLMAVLIERG